MELNKDIKAAVIINYVLYVQAGKGNVWHNGERNGSCKEDLLELPGMKME